MQEKRKNEIRKSLYRDGRRYWVRGQTERDAIRKLAKLEAELDANGARLDSRTTVRTWAKEWLDVYVNSRDITAKSAIMYQQKLNNHILPRIGDMRLCDVKDTHLQRLLNSCTSSFSHAQKVKLVMQAMFKQARKSRLIQYDPAEDLTIPKAPKGKRHSISEYERKNVLEVAESHRAGLFVLTMLFCGLRTGEAIAMQWKDVDIDNKILHINKAVESGNSSAVKEPKTASGVRDVPIPDALCKKMSAAKRSPFEPVFLQPNGKKRHTESSANDAWNNFKRALDIHMGADVYRNQITKHCWQKPISQETEQDWHDLVPYSLRHTYCTDLQRAGVPINVAKYLMGHSDISVTGNTYTDTTPDVVASAAESMEKFYAGKSENATEEMEKIAREIS